MDKLIKWHRHPGCYLSECGKYQLLPVGRSVDSTIWQAYRYNDDDSHVCLGVRVTPEEAMELCYLDAGGL
jgi:hypothetical protein